MNQQQADTRLQGVFQKLSKLKEAVADLKTATQAHTQQTQDFVNEAKKLKK
jgi:hypothetical protein